MEGWASPEAGLTKSVNTKSKIGLGIGAMVGTLLVGLLNLFKNFPTPGGYLVDRILNTGVPDPTRDARIIWAVEAAGYLATNFFCCLAIFYVVYLMLRKRL
jgi:hypothetical protein